MKSIIITLLQKAIMRDWLNSETLALAIKEVEKSNIPDDFCTCERPRLRGYSQQICDNCKKQIKNG
jgi:hypothetical protein